MWWTMKSMKDKFYIHIPNIFNVDQNASKNEILNLLQMKINFLLIIVTKINGWNWSALNHIQFMQQNWSIVQQIEWLVYVHNEPIVEIL